MVIIPSVLTRRSDISPQGLKHTEKDTPIGQHIRQCDSDSGSLEFNWKIIDQPVIFNQNGAEMHGNFEFVLVTAKREDWQFRWINSVDQAF